ncbi:MAG: hypothetical protein JNJ73_14880 [Hyphomonadaceae bacterium]|nr:hypothetical protein [Hyphomonadaceae bacterium]
MPIELAAMAAAAAMMTGGCSEEPTGPFELSANVAFVSDFRYRGVSLSGEDFALQGGFDVAHQSGFSAGVWASSIEPLAGATLELDLYAAYSLTVADTEFSLGATAFVYPDGEDFNFGELQASAARTLGPVDATLGVNYAWSQDNLGDEDNLYVYVNGALPLQTLVGLPLTLNGAFGYEDGVLAIEGEKLDWSLGLAMAIDGIVELGATYTGTDLDDPIGDGALVFSATRAF